MTGHLSSWNNTCCRSPPAYFLTRSTNVVPNFTAPPNHPHIWTASTYAHFIMHLHVQYIFKRHQCAFPHYSDNLRPPTSPQLPNALLTPHLRPSNQRDYCASADTNRRKRAPNKHSMHYTRAPTHQKHRNRHDPRDQRPHRTRNRS